MVCTCCVNAPVCYGYLYSFSACTKQAKANVRRWWWWGGAECCCCCAGGGAQRPRREKPGAQRPRRKKPGAGAHLLPVFKTGKNREKPGKTGSTGHETGRAMPREFNTHIPVLWPAVGCVFVALVRASSAQTGERLAASSKVCLYFTVGGHAYCTGSDEPWAPAPGLAAP